MGRIKRTEFRCGPRPFCCVSAFAFRWRPAAAPTRSTALRPSRSIPGTPPAASLVVRPPRRQRFGAEAGRAQGGQKDEWWKEGGVTREKINAMCWMKYERGRKDMPVDKRADLVNACVHRTLQGISGERIGRYFRVARRAKFARSRPTTWRLPWPKDNSVSPRKRRSRRLRQR